MKMKLAVLSFALLLNSPLSQAAVTIIGTEGVSEAKALRVEYGTMYDGGLAVWAQGYLSYVVLERSFLKDEGLRSARTRSLDRQRRG